MLLREACWRKNEFDCAAECALVIYFRREAGASAGNVVHLGIASSYNVVLTPLYRNEAAASLIVRRGGSFWVLVQMGLFLSLRLRG